MDAIDQMEFQFLEPKLKALNIVIQHIGSVLPSVYTLSVIKMYMSGLGAGSTEYYFGDKKTSIRTEMNEVVSEVSYAMTDDNATSQDDFVEINWYTTHIECRVKYEQVAANTMQFQILLEDLVEALRQWSSVIDETALEF
jgi:hypothetical protein